MTGIERWESYRKAAIRLEEVKACVQMGDEWLIPEEYMLEAMLDESWDWLGFIAKVCGDYEARLIYLHYLQGVSWTDIKDGDATPNALKKRAYKAIRKAEECRNRSLSQSGK